MAKKINQQITFESRNELIDLEKDDLNLLVPIGKVKSEALAG